VSLLDDLRAAAQAKGRPLTDMERAAVYAASQREALRERFRKVILGAGYKSAEGILAEWFDKYMQNVPEFVRMLESYEKNNYDPD